MGLFGNSQELQSETNKLWQKPQASPSNKGEVHFFMEEEGNVGKAVINQSVGGNRDLRV